MKAHLSTYKKDPRQYDFGVRDGSLIVHRISKWEEDKCAEVMAEIEGFFPVSQICVFS